ncbi:Alpha/beta hydrolase family protein [Enhygromyxa salina]|uniref:Alpha/beta hydrolase family protein n=1 Tax=Enhygromyxa salina TaxID=215803 RepID=A0A2S9XLQ9_9BACT|nr:alpha/beta fold hydrolase [Enhygromyxa salina]PRP93795.1 Alpha/beta hydrolase family protein [Enhygromyxa salina]
MAERVPVVLLHGALRTPLGMRPTARSLGRRGFDARSFGYATRRGTLDDHAEQLEARIRAWLDGRQTAVLGILTHSMGGLVARALLARPTLLELAPRQRLVMLAPPNKGAVLAERQRDFPPFRWLYGLAADELQPPRVAELPPPPPSCETLILVGGTGDGRGYNPRIDGDDDGVVASDETPLPGLEPEFVGGVHSTLQWRGDVLSRAAAFLAGGSS